MGKNAYHSLNMPSVVCFFSPLSTHHLFEGSLYDSHHQAFQTDNFLHVKAHWSVADCIWVLWFLCTPFLCLHLIWAAILGQADRRSTAGVLQEVADLPQAVSD